MEIRFHWVLANSHLVLSEMELIIEAWNKLTDKKEKEIALCNLVSVTYNNN